jgi:hypothetical protein
MRVTLDLNDTHSFRKTVLAMTYMRIQLRGAGDVARSLNVRGEEIYTALETVDDPWNRGIFIPGRGYY